MKIDVLEKLIRHIITETINVMNEEHDRGEWWIDDTGGTTYCDNQVVDQGHEAVVIQAVSHEILSHFGIEEVEPGTLDNYEESIKQLLIDDERLDQNELDGWDNIRSSGYDGPAEIIAKKLLEDKVFADEKQATDAVFIAYGSSRDARDYAMKYWNWKIMKTAGNKIEIQTWHLKPSDLQIIVRGIWDIMQEHDDSNEDDPDNEVGDDGFPGPRVNVTVQAAGKRYNNIPLSVLEKQLPQKIQAYRSGVEVGYTEAINESYHHLHKEYRLFEGNRHIVAVFEDNSRLKFEVHFREKRREDKEKWRRKAFTTWKSLANELHSDVQLTEAGNTVQKSWKECFQEALKDPKLQEFIRNKPYQRVYSNKDVAPCIDPVNFTQAS